MLKLKIEIKGEKIALGDFVKEIAQPVAKVIDKTLGTDLQHCASCEERRKKLNALFDKQKKGD